MPIPRSLAHLLPAAAIYLPPGYATAAAAGRRLAVLYLLHGSPGWPRLFMNAGALGVAMDTLVAQHRIGPFLVVMPDGRDGSFVSHIEWADTAHGRYESFVGDVVRAVDRRWPTIAGAQDPDTRQMLPFATVLRAAGADVVTQVLPGRHDWRLWRDQTPAMLRWAAATMGATR